MDMDLVHLTQPVEALMGTASQTGNRGNLLVSTDQPRDDELGWSDVHADFTLVPDFETATINGNEFPAARIHGTSTGSSSRLAFQRVSIQQPPAGTKFRFSVNARRLGGVSTIRLLILEGGGAEASRAINTPISLTADYQEFSFEIELEQGDRTFLDVRMIPANVDHDIDIATSAWMVTWEDPHAPWSHDYVSNMTQVQRWASPFPLGIRALMMDPTKRMEADALAPLSDGDNTPAWFACVYRLLGLGPGNEVAVFSVGNTANNAGENRYVGWFRTDSGNAFRLTRSDAAGNNVSSSFSGSTPFDPVVMFYEWTGPAQRVYMNGVLIGEADTSSLGFAEYNAVSVGAWRRSSPALASGKRAYGPMAYGLGVKTDAERRHIERHLGRISGIEVA